MGRLLAVDPGTRRVGLALSDPLQIIASPFSTILFENNKKFIKDLLRIIKDKDVETVIIGLPLKENGAEGKSCARSRQLAGLLQARGIETVLWDERYSSRRAESLLRDGGLKRKNAIDKIDRIAASYILEDYMSSRRNSEMP